MSWRFWWEPPCLLRTVIVNRKSDPESAIRAVLWERRGPWLVFRDAYLLLPQHEPQKLDGEVVIAIANIDFMQVL